jgi:hypothetical protein
LYVVTNKSHQETLLIIALAKFLSFVLTGFEPGICCSSARTTASHRQGDKKVIFRLLVDCRPNDILGDPVTLRDTGLYICNRDVIPSKNGNDSNTSHFFPPKLATTTARLTFSRQK